MQKRSKRINEVIYEEGLDDETIKRIEQMAAKDMTFAKMDAILDLQRTNRSVEFYAKKDPRVARALKRGPAMVEWKVKTKFLEIGLEGNVRALEWYAKHVLKIEAENSLRITVAPDIVYRSTVRADGSLIQEVLEEGMVLDAEKSDEL